MIANSTIKKRDKIFKCEVEISEKYGPPIVEVDYGISLLSEYEDLLNLLFLFLSSLPFLQITLM
jgi:hypothetical protein